MKKDRKKKVPVALIIVAAVLLGIAASCASLIYQMCKPKKTYPDLGLKESPDAYQYVMKDALTIPYLIYDTGYAIDTTGAIDDMDGYAMFSYEDLVITVETYSGNLAEHTESLSMRYFNHNKTKYSKYVTDEGYINSFHAYGSLYSYHYDTYTIYAAAYMLLPESSSPIVITVLGSEEDYGIIVETAQMLIHTIRKESGLPEIQEPVIENVNETSDMLEDETSKDSMTEESEDHTPVTYNSIGESTLEVTMDYDTMLVIFQYQNGSVTPRECYITSPDGLEKYDPVSVNVGNSGQILFEIENPTHGTWTVHYSTESEYMGYLYTYAYEKSVYEYIQDEDNKPVRGYEEDE